MNQSTNDSRNLQLQAAMFRLGNVEEEIKAGYKILVKHQKTVTVFGSARVEEASQYYQKAQALGEMLAQAGYSVVTGGGPGIMEAANRGAQQAGGGSIGFNITLPHEQGVNPYVTDSYSFHHFSPRKIVMTMMADAYVCFPGGFGTLDEFSEILTLLQTNKMPRVPIILFDKKFWGKWDDFVRQNLLANEHLISPGDEKIYTITDDLTEVLASIQQAAKY